MHIKKYFRNKIFISREYKTFSCCSTMIVVVAYGLFCYISYKNHQNTYNQKYLSLGLLVANSYEIFLDNITRQAEFMSHKMENKKQYERSVIINSLLKHRFSVDINLDTSPLSSWVSFQYLESTEKGYDLAKQVPWKINFDSTHSTGTEITDSYIPISFGITNKQGDFIGKLVSKINILDLVQYLQYSLGNKQLNILILDQENYIMAQSPLQKMMVPVNFFQHQKFTDDFGNLRQNNEFNNITFIAYKKLNLYPFTVVVGENKSIIFKPLIGDLIKYFYIFLAILITFLVTLLLFYKRTIAPIISLSNFADKIIHSTEEKINYTPKKHSFVEINNLTQALIKIESYKQNISCSNKELHEKTREMELIKETLEAESQKLYNSYLLRDDFNKKSNTNQTIKSTTKIIEGCIAMLYPEIYSKKLEIITSFHSDINLNINQHQFMQIISTLLSRSFMFSTKNSKVEIKTDLTDLNSMNYFCITITDNGIGEEEWRDQNFHRTIMDEIRTLIKSNNIILHSVNQDTGVKYCLLISQQESKTTEGTTNNILHLFPNTLHRVS